MSQNITARIIYFWIRFKNSYFIIKNHLMNYEILRQLIPKKSQQWTTGDVGKWLTFIHLQNYIPAFEKASIDGSCLKALTIQDLIQEIGIKSRIVCKKLLNWITNGLQQFDNSFEEADQNFNQYICRLLDPEINTQSNEQVREIGSEINQKKTVRRKNFNVLVLKKAQVKECFYYKIKQRDCRIGVDPNCEIQVSADTIHPFHAQVGFRNGQYYLRSISSDSVIFVKINSKMTVYHMGSNVFRFLIDGDMKLQVQTVEGSKNENYTFKFPTMKNKILVGRKSTNHISFPQDITLSNLHARLTYSESNWYLEDLATTNGSWLQLDKEIRVVSGMIFKLGLTNLLFECQLREVRENQSEQQSIIYQHKLSSQFCRECSKNIKNIMFVPCNHCLVCENCYQNVKFCPVCSQRVVSTIKIYKS